MSEEEEPSEDVLPDMAMKFAYISAERIAMGVAEDEEYQEVDQEEGSDGERRRTATSTVESSENGFHGVVAVSLAEVSGREETHTGHLVEGDFFPEDSPGCVELRGTDDSTAEVPPPQQEHGEEQRQEWKEDGVEKEEEQQQQQQQQHMGDGKETSQYHNGIRSKKGGETNVFPPWYTVPRRSVKRVRWADEVNVAAPLVQHATTFLLPLVAQTQQCQQQQQQQQQMLYGETDRTQQTLSPPPVFREEKNGDGSTYLSCRAQRPATRFVMWKRAALASGYSADEPPFYLQPLGNSPSTHSTTLLAALHPPYRAENVGTTVQMRVATISENAKKNGALCDGGLQMPMVRSTELLNIPLCIPF